MDDTRKLSFKDKIKQFFCFACCFTTNRRESESAGDNSKRSMFLIGSSSQWIKSRASVDLPEIKYKCRNLLSRIGNSNGVQQYHRRRRSSTDYSYDPLSYALNFEEESFQDDAPLNNFVSRLPSSPPRSVD
ncbi:hypothetical protein HanLR1_Chr05g0172361 [Helianthus annuus]|nr:hypothetical protein HanLR1_Chr05g0172361 [Helianthus annuus]